MSTNNLFLRYRDETIMRNLVTFFRVSIIFLEGATEAEQRGNMIICISLYLIYPILRLN
jgi:hypothetical protein